MRTPFRFSLLASMTTALLSTSALIPSQSIAAVSADDAGVSMTVTPGAESSPTLRMITRSEIQGERFTAGSFEVVELLLTDGTSLTMAAGTTLDVDSYNYDPATREGDLTVNMIRGTLRVIGGTLNNTQPITVTTPTSTLTLDNATVVIVVGADGTTRAGLEYGKSLTVTSDDGETVEVMRPGFEVTIADDGAISGPTRRPPGASIDIARTLNPGLITGIAPETGLEDGVTDDVGDINEEEQQVAQIEDDLTDTEPALEPFDFGGGGGETGGSGGFDAGTIVGAINLSDNLPSDLTSTVRTLAQDRDPSALNGGLQPPPGGDDEPRRSGGLTTNRVYNSEEALTSDLQGQNQNGAPDFFISDSEFSAPTSELRYVFYDGVESFVIVGEDVVNNIGDFLESGDLDFDDGTSPLVLKSNFVEEVFNFPEEGHLKRILTFNSPLNEDKASAPVDLSDNTSGETNFNSETLFDNAIVSISQSGFRIVDTTQLDGTIWEGYTDLGSLSIDNSAEFLVDRRPDNFVIIQINPAQVTATLRDKLRGEFSIEQIRSDAAARENFADQVGLRLFGDPDDDDVVIGVAEIVLGSGDVESGLTSISQLDELDRDSILNRVNTPQLGIVDPNRTDSFIFAAGDVDADLDTERRLDVFALSPGLDGLNEHGELEDGGTVAPSIRAFLRNATAFREEDGSGGIPLGDTGLMIIGTPANSVPGIDPDEQSGLLHADIGMAGEGKDQKSTVSVTIGHVQYDVDLDEDDGFPGEEVVLQGRTIASTQDDGNSASTLVSGEVFNTSAGGGRPVDTNGDGEPDTYIPGRSTYFVIENFEPGAQSPAAGDGEDDMAQNGGSRSGGVERPIGGGPDDDMKFAILRLATSKSSTLLEPGEGGKFSGVSAGMLETETDGNQVNITPFTSDFTLELAPENNRIFVDGRTFDFGGITGEDTKGESVYIDDHRFAARTNQNGSDLAMVSGKVLQDAAAALPEDNVTREFLDVPDYKHLKWGFFFGDTAPVDGEDGDKLRQHVHLGSWIAGKMAKPDRLPTSGTATYSGHAFGNVLNKQSLYAARGTYENKWNFGSRAGLVNMDFDGANLVGLTRLKDGTVMFEGSLEGDDRNAGVIGVFVEGKKGERKPAGQFGTFQIRGKKYNAIGTFGAERKRK